MPHLRGAATRGDPSTVYVRAILQRLAPIPTWFDEGLATGFEANAGKINVGPGKISFRYANQALESHGSTGPSWSPATSRSAPPQVAALTARRGDCMALGHPVQARVRDLPAAVGQKKPLQAYRPQEQRRADFEQAFGDKLPEMQSQFQPLLEGLRRTECGAETARRKGNSLTEEDLGQVELTASAMNPGPGPQGGLLESKGCC